jgi:hypothetical protein
MAGFAQFPLALAEKTPLGRLMREMAGEAGELIAVPRDVRRHPGDHPPFPNCAERMVRVRASVALEAKTVSGTDKSLGDVGRVRAVARRATPFPNRVMDRLPARRHVVALKASLFQPLKLGAIGKVRVVAPRALA